MEFLPRDRVLSLEECLRVVRTASLGWNVTKVRITGGEPLVRRNVMWLLERIAALDGLNELVLTTNGSQLDRYATDLIDAGVKRINVSLDTLKPDRFKAITRIGDLEKVLRGIDAARKAGFKRTKLNTVMMRGTNDDEFADLVAYAVANDLNISFIEEMPLGDVGHGRGNTYFQHPGGTGAPLQPVRAGCPRWRRRVARPATGAFLAPTHASASSLRTATISAIPAIACALPPRGTLSLPRPERCNEPDAAVAHQPG